MRVVLAVALAAGCRIDLDHASYPDAANPNQTCQMGSSAACMEAPTHSDLAWIQSKVFTANCVFSGCHNGGTSDAGKIDLSPGQAFVHLVNAKSDLDPSRMLVVPGDPAKSYLSVMIGKIKPGDAVPPAGPIPKNSGTMPQGHN